MSHLVVPGKTPLRQLIPRDESQNVQQWMLENLKLGAPRSEL
jgi:hypothetical protein